jgi:hypothetical protein
VGVGEDVRVKKRVMRSRIWGVVSDEGVRMRRSWSLGFGGGWVPLGGLG